MNFEQIAIYVHDEDQADYIKRFYGAEKWIIDEPVGTAVVDGMTMELHAKLQFNYDVFNGKELELITCEGSGHIYASHPQWSNYQPFIAHFGCHVEEWPDIDAPLRQEMWTRTHTNPHLLEIGRTYHYKVYDTLSRCGVFTKLIKRINHG
jgi:hypothetical protein